MSVVLGKQGECLVDPGVLAANVVRVSGQAEVRC